MMIEMNENSLIAECSWAGEETEWNWVQKTNGKHSAIWECHTGGWNRSCVGRDYIGCHVNISILVLLVSKRILISGTARHPTFNLI